MKRLFLFFLALITANSVKAQCNLVDFTLGENVACKNENVLVTHNYDEEITIIDFCTNDLTNDPVLVSEYDLSDVIDDSFGYE